MLQLGTVLATEVRHQTLDNAGTVSVNHAVVNRDHALRAGRDHKINDFLNLRPGGVNRYQNGLRLHAVGHHEGVTRVVQAVVEQVADVADYGNQRMNQGVLAAEGLHVEAGDGELGVRLHNGHLSLGRGLQNDLGDLGNGPNLQRVTLCDALGNNRQYRGSVKVVGVGVGNEQVLRALQGLGVLSLGGKITGVNRQDVSVVLDADAGVGVLR